MNSKSGKLVVSPRLSKNDTRYWQSRVFKPRHVEAGTATSQTTCYFVRFQFAGRRISITLGTANQTEAAVRAKERFLFLSSNGWKAFLEKYKPEDRAPALVKRSNITVGEFIAAATS